MPDDDSFVYSPLEDHRDAIRLVRIAGLDEEGYFNILLENAILRTKAYVALSYVWGDDPAVYEIKVNGRAFHIRRNLWSFLVACNVDEHIWVDALCIDQRNVAEKNKQVPLMGRIFSQASKVICWLRGGISATVIQDRNGQWIENLQHKDFHDNADLIAHDLLRLSKHAYWSRLWIVQELQLGERIEVLWEGHTLSGERLAYILDTDVLERTNVLRTAEQQDGEAIHMLRSLLARRNAFLLPLPHEADLFTLVLKYGNLLGSLQHDRVYALIALASNGTSFMVDYTESRTTLLARLLHHCTTLPDWDDIMNVAHSLGVDLERPAFTILTLCEESNAVSLLQANNTFKRCMHCFQLQESGEYPDLIIGIPNVIYFGLINTYTMFGPRILLQNDGHDAGPGIASRYSVCAVIDTDRLPGILNTGALHLDDFTLLKDSLSHFTFATLGASTTLTFRGTISNLLKLLTSTRQTDALWRSRRWITCAEAELQNNSQTICTRLRHSHHEIVSVSTSQGISDPDKSRIPRVIKWIEPLGPQGEVALTHFLLLEDKEVRTWEEVRSLVEEHYLLRAGMPSIMHRLLRPRDSILRRSHLIRKHSE